MKSRLARPGVLLIAVAFLGYWTLLVYCDVWRPTPPGLLLNFNGARVAVVDVVSGAPAQRTGLRAGDHIAAIDGHPLAGLLDWMTAAANVEIGRTIRLMARRGIEP